MISTLPVTTDGSPKGSVVHSKDIESRVPTNESVLNAIQFIVRANKALEEGLSVSRKSVKQWLKS